MSAAVLRVPRSSAQFPDVCPCCLATADSSLILQNTKTYPLLIASIHQTTSVEVPYCKACVTHVIWHQDGGLAGSLLRAVLVFLLTAGVVGLPAGFMLLGAWLRAGDSGSRVVMPPSAQIASGVALVAGSLAAVVSLLRRLRARPLDALDARHTHPTAALSLVGSDTSEYFFSAQNPAYVRELVAQVPGVVHDRGVVLKSARQWTLLHLLLLLAGLVGAALGIREAWGRMGH